MTGLRQQRVEGYEVGVGSFGVGGCRGRTGKGLFELDEGLRLGVISRLAFAEIGWLS